MQVGKEFIGWLIGWQGGSEDKLSERRQSIFGRSFAGLCTDATGLPVPEETIPRKEHGRYPIVSACYITAQRRVPSGRQGEIFSQPSDGHWFAELHDGQGAGADS